MATTLWEAPTSNAFQTTLGANVAVGATTISLTSATGLVAPGILVIDRQDGAGNDTPSKREYVSFTGISTNDITGVTKAVDGSTDQAHSSGALVEAVIPVSYWNDLVDYLAVEHNAAGVHDPTLVAMLAGAQTHTGAKTFQKIVQTVVAATDGATVTFDLSAGNIQRVTLGGNRTLALSNVSVGQVFVLELIQDGTGSRTVTWFSTIKWPDNTAPTLTTTASKTDVFIFICTSSGNYEGFVVDQNL